MPVALILTGGQGERLRPLTDSRPKPMVEVAGRPILDYQVEWFALQGVTTVIFAGGYRHEVVQDYFGDGSRHGVQVIHSIEAEPLGRGGALKQAFMYVGPDEPWVFAMNGDNLTDQPLKPLVQRHLKCAALATVVVRRLVSPFGITRLDHQGMIVGFEEKPSLPFWLNAGLYVLSRGFFEILPDRGDHETTTMPRLAEAGRLAGFRSYARWRTIDTLKDLAEASREAPSWGRLRR